MLNEEDILTTSVGQNFKKELKVQVFSYKCNDHHVMFISAWFTAWTENLKLFINKIAF